MKFLLLSGLALLSFTASGAAREKAPDKIFINVIRGEMKTQFQIEPASNKVTLVSTRGANRSRNIGKENMQYLVGETQKLKTIQKLPSECMRSKMEVISISGKKQELKQSCFAGGSITSKQYEGLANLLAVEI